MDSKFEVLGKMEGSLLRTERCIRMDELYNLICTDCRVVGLTGDNANQIALLIKRYLSDGGNLSCIRICDAIEVDTK